MRRSELETIVQGGESGLVEFKTHTSRGCLSEAACTLAAMLNGNGGRVLFGVTDDGAIRGQEVGDGTFKSVWAALDQIKPGTAPEVETVVLDGGRSVLAVSVVRGAQRPYRVRGVPYKRVGTSTVEMTEGEAQALTVEAAHGVARWESEPLANLTVDDLDENEIRRTVREAVRRGRVLEPTETDVLSLLRGFGLVKEDRPTRAAAVLFGSTAFLQSSLPQCKVRLARFRGTDKTEFLDQRQEIGNAFRLLDEAGEFLRRNLPVAGRIVGGVFERRDDPVYPPEALREALANAFCHRDYAQAGGTVSVAIYDDRLEISSPGGLHFGLLVEDLYRSHDSRPWNPDIANTFYRRGIIESWGRGTVRMTELTESVGLPRPEFEDGAGALVVRFRPDVYIPPARVGRSVSERQQDILRILAQSRAGASLSEIQDALGAAVPKRAVQTDLHTLRQLDLAEGRGHGRGARWLLKGGVQLPSDA